MSTYDEAKLQEYISSLEREKAMMDDMNTPLTKPKRAVKKVDEPIPQQPVEPPLQTQAVAPTAPPKEKKPRKPKTPAQLAAFQKMLDAKNNNWKRRKIDQRLNDVKELLKVPKQPAPQQQPSNSSSDEEPVIIQKDKKKKKKKIIIVDSSDSSDSESSYEKVEQPIEHKKEHKDFGKARQNKNSYVKPSEPKPQYTQQQNQQQKPRNFFCD